MKFFLCKNNFYRTFPTVSMLTELHNVSIGYKPFPSSGVVGRDSYYTFRTINTVTLFKGYTVGNKKYNNLF